MESKEKFNALTYEVVILEFEIVVLQRVFECSVTSNMTLKKALESLQDCCHDELVGWYDFADAIVMDARSKQYLKPSWTLAECGCSRGSKLLIY